ncbi:Thioesterase superfamily protein [gamma proteobacterium HdN1]|nr:Thioesterase superfamily protein [gamma proteobacterium HdN1]
MRTEGILTRSAIVKVPFHDVDRMSVVWHGHYAKYLEIARCELLDSIRYNYDEMEASGFLWPIIDMQMRYIKGARFGQEIRISASLVEWEHRLKINYLITAANNGERLLRASTTQVAVSIANGEMQWASPDILLQRVSELHSTTHQSFTNAGDSVCS